MSASRSTESARRQVGRRALLALLLAGAVAACGKKGSLELPPDEPEADEEEG